LCVSFKFFDHGGRRGDTAQALEDNDSDERFGSSEDDEDDDDGDGRGGGYGSNGGGKCKGGVY